MKLYSHTKYSFALNKAAFVKLLILDVDGVLTDGSIFINQNGREELKVFNTLDGYGIKLLQEIGIQVAVITGRRSYMVQDRFKKLGIRYIMMGVKDKKKALNKLLADVRLNSINCAAVGDDWPDLAILMNVGFSACPFQAHQEIKKRVDFQSKSIGGHGAVREVCDFILIAQNHYKNLLNKFL